MATTMNGKYKVYNADGEFDIVHLETNADQVKETTNKKVMTAAERTKLSGIATNANNYVHPTSAGNKHVPAGGASGQILGWNAAGEAKWVAPYAHPTSSGNKHIPAGGSANQFLQWAADGTASWSDVAWGEVTGKPNVCVLDGSGKVPLTNIPAAAITDTFVVANQTEMLAVVAQKGDVAIRNDLSKSFILQGDDPTVLSNWVELKTPADKVSSVNGMTGAVTIATPGTINTNNTSAQSAGTESLTGTINLHKVSKTGNYNDLLNRPTIPTVGNLITNATTAQTASAGESMKGDITLHKIAKTGSYNDLLNRPTLKESLASLNDTTISSAANGQLLRFNGTSWVNWTPNYLTSHAVTSVNGKTGAVRLTQTVVANSAPSAPITGDIWIDTTV